MERRKRAKRGLGRRQGDRPELYGRMRPGVLMGLGCAGILGLMILIEGIGRLTNQTGTMIGRSLAGAIREAVCMAYLPSAVYTKPHGIADEILAHTLGWYGYWLEESGAEAEEEVPGEYIDGESLQAEALQELLKAENEQARAESLPVAQSRSGVESQPGVEGQSAAEDASDAEDTFTEGDLAEADSTVENTADETVMDDQTSTFIPHTQQTTISDEVLQDADAVLQTFYTVDSNTAVLDGQIDAQRFLETDLTLDEAEGDGPQILIYHTHSQEGFADSTEGDPSTTIVGVGEYLAQILTETYGYRVLHHTGEYDVPDRDSAYGEALPALEQLLADNPSIEVVIDLHRDQMDESTRLVTEIDGKPTARFMFFNGLSYTKKTGAISYLNNENLEGNLAFSFRMQKAAAEYYPGLTRKIYLKGYRYNMHLRARTLLVELGAQNNTVEEAMNACEPLAHLLSLVLQ